MSLVPVEAVLFDLGGVVLGSPLEGIVDYEKDNNIPLGFVNVNIVSRGEIGAFQLLERGLLTMAEFYPKFKKELEDPKQLETFADFTKQDIKKLPGSLTFDTEKLFHIMLEKSFAMDGDFVHALMMLRGHGIKVGALTNNFAPMGSSAPGSINLEVLQDLFDDVIESAVEGVRKPDPKAFHLACERLKVTPNQVVFLDDIGINVKSARGLGMETILVKLKDKSGALKMLQDAISRRNNVPIQILRTSTIPIAVSWTISTNKTISGKTYGYGANTPVILLEGRSDPFWEKICERLAREDFFLISVTNVKDELELDLLIKKIGIENRRSILIGEGFTCLKSNFVSSLKCTGIVLFDTNANASLKDELKLPVLFTEKQKKTVTDDLVNFMNSLKPSLDSLYLTSKL